MQKYFRFSVGSFSAGLGLPDEFEQTGFVVRGIRDTEPAACTWL